jgi:lysozyme
MNPDNEALLIAELRFDEGVRYTPYADTEGIPTVGVGHNLQASPLPSGWTYPLTGGQVDELLRGDLQNVYGDLTRALPWWTDLNDVRQRVICNMGFNLGMSRLIGFKNALIAMRQGRFSDAADEMLDSKWAKEDVGIGTPDNPGRALRLANMMRKGM